MVTNYNTYYLLYTTHYGENTPTFLKHNLRELIDWPEAALPNLDGRFV